LDPQEFLRSSVESSSILTLYTYTRQKLPHLSNLSNLQYQEKDAKSLEAIEGWCNSIKIIPGNEDKVTKRERERERERER